jgi:putative ABC transport system permease protein
MRALGASPSRIAKGFLAEAALLSGIASIAAVTLAVFAVDWILLKIPFELPRLDEVRLGASEIGFAVCASAAVAFSLGTLPMLHHGRLDPLYLRHEATLNEFSPAPRLAWRKSLTVLQVGASVAVLITAGLMVRSFEILNRANLGFSPGQRLVFRVALPPTKYGSDDDATQFHDQFLQKIRALPGVRSAALATLLPLEGDGMRTVLELRSQPATLRDGRPSVLLRRASDGYLRTLGIPLVRGRSFTPDDMTGVGSPALVNQALATAYFPGQETIGQYVRPDGAAEGWFRIAGIFGNTPVATAAEGLPTSQLLVPLRSDAAAPVPDTLTVSYAVHATVPAVGLLRAIRDLRSQIDPDAVIERPQTASELVERTRAAPRFSALLVGLAAAASLLLGLVGVYSVVAYGLASRSRELALRLALGAPPRELLVTELRQALVVLAMGTGIGILVALLGNRALQSQLIGVSWHDPVTYAAAALGVLAVGTASALFGTRELWAISPARLLR